MRALLHTANTVEFEWIRQYYFQGPRHNDTHLWWQGPMQELVDMWHEMRKKTNLALEVLQDAAGKYYLSLENIFMLKFFSQSPHLLLSLNQVIHLFICLPNFLR